jgi:hypothetical protein
MDVPEEAEPNKDVINDLQEEEEQSIEDSAEESEQEEPIEEPVEATEESVEATEPLEESVEATEESVEESAEESEPEIMDEGAGKKEEEKEDEDEDEDDEDEDEDDEDEDLDEDDEDEDLDEDSSSYNRQPYKKTKTNNLKLAQMFQENMNKLNLDKSELVELEQNVKTKNDTKYYLNALELLNMKELNASFDKNYKFLYPHLDDEFFNIKIAYKKEFAENKLQVNIDSDFEKLSNEICDKDFELAPYQKFIKNFLSTNTPYNGLLLYHGLGTGKTCSAIGVAEETRKYLKYMGYNERIIIVASPNVQENFYLQLFDERKLEFKNNNWTINNCAGQSILDEINSTHKKLTREKVVKIMTNIINNYYLFMGYTQFANLIIKKSNPLNPSNPSNPLNPSNPSTTLDNTQKKKIAERLQKFFDNRLIIIDEFHNIRQSKDNTNKLVSNELLKLVKNVNNLKLLFLSATPMFNDYKEIIFLINILNMNDRRSIVDIKDIFNSDGSFLVNSKGEEVGLQLFKRKINGYISYVKGDNPLSFPFRILPNDFAAANSIKTKTYPQFKINGTPLTQSIELFDIYINEGISPYQEFVYNIILKNNMSKFDEDKLNNMDSFGYTLLQKPLEALNIVFPNSKLESYFEEKLAYNEHNITQLLETLNLEEINSLFSIKEVIGKAGINNLMSYQESYAPKSRHNYSYKTSASPNIFDINNIGKYSYKIKSIIDSIIHSNGPIIVYSQFIDAGLIPIALTLESIGFTRYGTNRSLFLTPQSEELDIASYKKKSELGAGSKFHGAKYIIISGNENLSPDVVGDLKAATDSNNSDGKNVKVILLSAAGSEGIDLKFIRQVHILEPWFNINRIEQIIGRAIRTCSHKNMPLNERNVQIFMHGTLLHNNNESVDLLIYRKAEAKAKVIGVISRILKEHSIDCMLNYEQQKFDEKLLNKKLTLTLSNNASISYSIGDKSYSPLCDYMAECSYKCKPELEDYKTKMGLTGDIEENNSSYNEFFLQTNNEAIVKLIRDLFKEKYFCTKEYIISYLTSFNNYSTNHINNALDQLVNNENSYITDKYNTLGKLINVENLYIFQPSQLNNDATIFERSNPIQAKPDGIAFALPETFDVFDDKAKTVYVDKTEVEKPLKVDDVEPVKTKVVKTKINFALFDDDYLSIELIDNVKSLIIELEINYNYITNIQANQSTDDNKYIHYGSIIKLLAEESVLDSNSIQTLAIAILLDDLNIEKTTLLVNYLLNNGYDLKGLSKFESELARYYEEHFIMSSDGKLRALIVPQKSEFKNYTLYIITKSKVPHISGSNMLLTLGQSEDYDDFAETITMKKVASLDLAQSLGFLALAEKNKQEYITYFKIKSGTNKGARCSQAGKAHSEKIFVAIGVSNNIIEKLKKYNQIAFCNALEIYFRYYDLIKKDDKRWFFNLVQSLINNFS